MNFIHMCWPTTRGTKQKEKKKKKKKKKKTMKHRKSDPGKSTQVPRYFLAKRNHTGKNKISAATKNTQVNFLAPHEIERRPA